MPNKIERWIRSGVQACMSCILPPKSSVHPPDKKKRKKRRFWMIRRTNKVGVTVSTVPDTIKKDSKTKSDGMKASTDTDAKCSPKTGRPLPPAPKRKVRVNPNCKDCINKVHSPRKMKARLSAKIQARRDQDSLDTPNTAAEERKESDEVETYKKESGKLHVIDLDADNVGCTSGILKGDTDVCDNIQNGHDDDDDDDIVCGEQGTSHDDNDDIVCGGAYKSVEKRKVVEYDATKDEVEKPIEHDDDDIVCGTTDTGHDDDDDIVCGRADKSVEKVVQHETRTDEVEKQIEHADDEDSDVSDDATDHDDDDYIVIGTASQCTYPLNTEAVSQKQVNEVDFPTLSEIYDADSSSDSASESDNEHSNSDTIPEHSGLEMSMSYKQDGSSKNGTASDVHDDDDDVVCSDQPANSKVKTMEDKQERDGRHEGDSESHEDDKDTLLGGHSENSDQLLAIRDSKESKLMEKDVPGQGSISLDKIPTPTRTYSPGKGSYADLILNLASVIGDMKSSSSSSYESRAKLFGELLGGMKNVNKSDNKDTDPPIVKEVISHKMAGDMNVESSDDRATSPEIPKSSLIGEGPDQAFAAKQVTSKDSSQTKSNQTSTKVDPLDDIDQLLDEASKLF